MSLATWPLSTVRHLPRAHVSQCSRASRTTCALYILSLLAHQAIEQMVQVSLHTGVYCDTGSLCTGVYRGWWCGRGEGGPGTDPLLTVRGPALTAAPPPAPPQTLVTSHSGECPTSTLQSTMLFDDRQFCFNISG